MYSLRTPLFQCDRNIEKNDVETLHKSHYEQKSYGQIHEASFSLQQSAGNLRMDRWLRY